MFKLIKGTALNAVQLDQIAHLLLETGYYEYTGLNNKLNLSPTEFRKVQTLKPYAEYTHVLVDGDDVAGFFIAGTKSQIATVAANTPDWRRDDPEFTDFKKISHYYEHEILETDFIAFALAVSSKYKGLGLILRILTDHQAHLARKENCTRIAFAVWESKPAAKLFQRCGAKITGDIDLRHTSLKDRIFKGVFNL